MKKSRPAVRGDLNVTREYFRLKLEDAGSKLNWTLTPLTGEINSGDLIVVKLRLTGKKARQLMLEDPIRRAPSRSTTPARSISATTTRAGPTGTARESSATGARCSSWTSSRAT